MALADFWEVKDNYEAGTAKMLNVYHVKRILVGANATIVGQAFIDTILTGHLLAMQAGAVTRSTVDIRNLDTPTDFVSLDTSALVATRAGDTLPNFTAVKIVLNRTRSDMRNGQKRFYAGTETDVDGNLWNATFEALIDAIAAALIAPWEQLSAPGVGVVSLAVLKRFCVVPEQEPCLKYRLPENDTEVDENHYVPVTTITGDLVTSQVSRKRTA